MHHAFLYISLPSLHGYDVKMPNCKFYGGRKQATTNLVLSLNLNEFLKKSTPGKFAWIEKTGIHFKTNVFAAVAVVDAKLSSLVAK